MTEHSGVRRPPSLSGLISGGLVVAGVLLWMFVSKSLLFVAGLGAFGPGILRELGWLRDQDEFQRQSAHRAGYHAYLIGGLATVIVVSAFHWRETLSGAASEWVTLILVILWLTWLFSAVLEYWGAVRTAARVLVTFGSFWAVFVIADIVGEADLTGDPIGFLLGVLMGIVFVGPFFVLAFTAKRWPRATGGVLLAVSAFFIVLTLPGAGNLNLSTQLLTSTLLIVPMIACGLALLRADAGSDLRSGENAQDEVPG